MKIEIKNCFSGEVIFGGEYDTALACLLAAVAANVDLGDADLRRANLYGADLSGADLRRASLYGADLYGADLRRANLYGADLGGANLYGANLSEAELRRANLGGASLRGADLRRANLSGANLSGANLYGANLYGANLRRADLRGSNLYDADLRGANLGDADLRGANLGENPEQQLWFAQTRIVSDGDITGWKKCKGHVIVKLRIPADAKRSHAFGRKCRAEYAEVVEILGADVAISQHDGNTIYRVGETVRPDSFDPDWRNECAPGIHFFITRLEAENY